jgi:predicted aconitase with swiveling domain
VEFISHTGPLVAGNAQGELLSAPVGLCFWGGVDPQMGIAIDQHHPLCGESLAGCVLAIPSGRGSCSGSGVLLEPILNGHAPAAAITRLYGETRENGPLQANYGDGEAFSDSCSAR